MATTRDVILIGVIIFMLGTGFFVINFATKTMVTSIVAIPAVSSQPSAVAAFNGASSVVDRLDYVVFGTFIALMLGLLISGWFIGGEPVFMFIYFCIIGIGIVFSTVLANVWSDISTNPVFGATIASFPITNQLLSYLPIYVAVIGALGCIIMFSKPFIARLQV